MTDTTLDTEHLKAIGAEYVTLSLTNAKEVQSWTDEPTACLRWKDGVLEQMHWQRGFNAFGHEIERRQDWQPVPTTP